jgi:hypothetical protein
MLMSPSPPAVFRMISATGPITLLWDRVDTIFTEVVAARWNYAACSTRATKAPQPSPVAWCRARSPTIPVFSCAALTGLAGKMPPTITTRAITVHLRRKKRTDETDDTARHACTYFVQQAEQQPVTTGV